MGARSGDPHDLKVGDVACKSHFGAISEMACSPVCSRTSASAEMQGCPAKEDFPTPFYRSAEGSDLQ